MAWHAVLAVEATFGRVPTVGLVLLCLSFLGAASG